MSDMNTRSYECQGYFLLVSSAEKLVKMMQKVPASISTVEVLIFVDNEVNESSLIFDINLYKHANVNILTKSEMWSLSENFLFPRVFKNVTKYEVMKRQSGIINLQGQLLQGSAFYNPPFCYLSTSVNKTINGIEGEFFIANDARELDGVEFQLFILMAQRLNFTWMIRKPNNNYRYGRKNGSDWNGGMIGQIFRKEVDIAFSGIWLKKDNYEFANLSISWYQLFIHFLVPRPKPKTSFWALTRPLSSEVWLAIIATILFQSINVYIKAKINHNVPRRFETYINTLTELIARLLGTWAPKRTQGLRVQLHLWHVTGLLFVTAYCSSLASRLTTPDYETRIDTIPQLVAANLSWGREGPIPKFDDYFNLNDTYGKYLSEQFESEHSLEERHRKIAKENYAIVGRIVESIFFPENEVSNSDLKNYRVMKTPVNNYYTAFAVQPWLLQSVDTMMLWMKETGIIKYHFGNTINRRASYSLRNVLKEYDMNNGAVRVLILKPLGAGFAFLFIGLIIATFEAQGYTRSKSNSSLVYDYKACSQDSNDALNFSRDQGQQRINADKKEGRFNTSATNRTAQKIDLSIKDSSITSPKTSEKTDSNYVNTNENRGGHSLANKVKDPAEMSLSERMALFERNKGEALIPKAPLTLSVPTRKLQESQKITTQSGDNQLGGRGKIVTTSRALFEQGAPKQELENDILRDTQTERQKELEMLRTRFNKNKEVAQVAAGSCIRPRHNSETNNSSPKNSPVCPVKPTPATVKYNSTDHVPPPPPLPAESMQARGSPIKRQVTDSPSKSLAQFTSPLQLPQRNVINRETSIKRIRVSPPKPGHLYPDLTNVEYSDTDTTDTEYTVGTTEPETVTLDERTDTDNYNLQIDDNQDSNCDDSANTSFETSILRAVTRQTSTNKRQIEFDGNSSTSDISVLDEMDEYLDECLAHQETQNNGPTPPKMNRAGASPSMTSTSFKYTQGSSYRSPIKVTPTQKSKDKSCLFDNNTHVPLMHSVSFYRRQQSQTPNKSTPVRQINRENELGEDQQMTTIASEKREMTLVQEKIKRLMDEVCKQQTIIGQASQALNLCTATVEFSGSREQVEGERLLLVATHRRQAALNEIQRLKVEGSLRPTIAGASEIQESGSLTISAMTLPLKLDHTRNIATDICQHFVCLVRHLDVIIATPIVQAEPGDACIRFPSTIKLDDLSSNFKITIEVYSLETRAEILPHEVKYHIHNINGSSSGNSGKKMGNKTPKKFLKHESRLVMPSVQSPAGPSAVRSPAFVLSGYVVFSLREVNRQQFTLNKVPRNSSLEGHLQMHIACELSVDIEYRGFLTMFEDVSGFGAWHRRWCLLKGDTLSYWKYPDDERKKTPIGSLELQAVVTTNVGLVPREICARPHTLLLETVRPSLNGEPDSLVVVRNGSETRIRHLLSADTKEERLEWTSKLNKTLSLIRAWGGMSSNML
ncbi:hypothetical protein PV327_010014 [Microctonus hyperodae]|uniref:PH domain-containing protein n=1 Tax=Microctonus hyperodae TaxID=165561 RepID=A0AA39F259_MICHY|nr:hypothetical protein PV327_010014 [Microctonus hyperodae]